MAGPTPSFTVTYLVDEHRYGAFIGTLRQNVSKYCTNMRKDGIFEAVLSPERAVPKRWFFVVLRNTHVRFGSITLAIRMDNLCLIGFRTLAGVWWEFGEEGDTRLIAGSTWLGFGGRYKDLIGNKELHTVALGRRQMREAIEALANHGAADGMVTEEQLQGAQADPCAVPKGMLAKLVIMVCEGLRFLTVSGTVEKNFALKNPTITETEGKQVNAWDRICVAVFSWAEDPTAKFPDLEALGVKNGEKVVALLKFQKPA